MLYYIMNRCVVVHDSDFRRQTMRKFLSAGIPCEAGCKYCFAKWVNYKQQPAIGFEQETIDSDQIILYPCCDGDFFNQIDLVDIIKQFSESHTKVYVSLSSKIWPTENQINQLVGLNEWLAKTNKGFVKFAISLSNRSMLDEIEPATMSYEQRIELANYINSIDLPLSLTIKPVLPFIPKDEYASILEDFSPFLNHVLIGGLYINKSSCFYRDYLQNDYVYTKRRVTWMPNHPAWDYVEDAELMEEIKTFAQKLNMKVFTSDSAVVKSLIEGVC